MDLVRYRKSQNAFKCLEFRSICVNFESRLGWSAWFVDLPWILFPEILGGWCHSPWPLR